MFVPYWSLIVIGLSLSLILGCGALWIIKSHALSRTLAAHIHKMANSMLDDRMRIAALNVELAKQRSAALRLCPSAADDAQKPKGPVH